MTEDEAARGRSDVVPLLLAALVCDAATTEPSSQKPSLIGIFDQVNVQRFPTQRPMHLFFKVTDAEGYYELAVKYVRVATNTVLAKAQGQITAHDRLSPTSMLIPFPPLPIPEPGRYEFQILANDVYLGSATIEAKPQVPLGQKEQ